MDQKKIINLLKKGLLFDCMRYSTRSAMQFISLYVVLYMTNVIQGRSKSVEIIWALYVSVMLTNTLVRLLSNYMYNRIDKDIRNKIGESYVGNIAGKGASNLFLTANRYETTIQNFVDYADRIKYFMNIAYLPFVILIGSRFDIVVPIAVMLIPPKTLWLYSRTIKKARFIIY